MLAMKGFEGRPYHQCDPFLKKKESYKEKKKKQKAQNKHTIL